MWFVTALIVGAIVTALIFWMRSRGMQITWYEILIGAVGVLLLLFGLQNYAGFNAEFESSAASTSLLLLVLPAVVIIAVAALLTWRSNRSAA